MGQSIDAIVEIYNSHIVKIIVEAIRNRGTVLSEAESASFL